MRIKTICSNCIAVTSTDKNYLFSYNLLVAVYNYTTGVLNVCDHHYSQTTTRHFNKWKSEYKICSNEVKVTRSEIESI